MQVDASDWKPESTPSRAPSLAEVFRRRSRGDRSFSFASPRGGEGSTSKGGGPSTPTGAVSEASFSRLIRSCFNADAFVRHASNAEITDLLVMRVTTRLAATRNVRNVLAESRHETRNRCEDIRFRLATNRRVATRVSFS